jgi:ribonuclease P protein component
VSGLGRLLYSRRNPVGVRCFAALSTRSNLLEKQHQADVSTQETLSAQDPWFPRPHGDTRRTPGAQSAAPQGPQAPDAGRASVNRRHRLRGRGRFTALRSTRVDVRRGGLRLRAAGNGLDVSRVSLAVVGARTAVERNLLRRRLRAVVAPLIRAVPGRDVLVSVPGNWVQTAFPEIAVEVAHAWKQAEQRLMDLHSTARFGDQSADNGRAEVPEQAVPATI